MPMPNLFANVLNGFPSLSGLNGTKWEHFWPSPTPDWSSQNPMLWERFKGDTAYKTPTHVAHVTAQLLSIHKYGMCVRPCAVIPSSISLSRFATDQSIASFMPFSPPVTFLHTANLQKLLISISLPDCLSLSHSLNHHRKATEETRSKRSISALLIHSLPSRTQSSHDKSLDGNYLCRGRGRPYEKCLDGQQSLFHRFKN